VDAVVQSTDKNFMVPVGGSIVAGGPGQAGFIEAVNSAYPGRASATPMLDLLITLLHWGASGWQNALQVGLGPAGFFCRLSRPSLTAHPQHKFPLLPDLLPTLVYQSSPGRQ